MAEPLMLATASTVIDAHGGVARWQRAQRFEAVVSAKGLAFNLKRRNAFDHVTVAGDVHHPRCCLTPIGADPGVSAVLDGAGVRIEGPEGTLLARQGDSRAGFPYGGHRLWRWDDLDMGYFANYAFWSYFTLPALLMRDDIAWSEVKPGCLRAQFPETIPAHSRVQTYWFDLDNGMLTRHAYTAEVIGGWAKAVQRVSDIRDFDGIPVPTRRVVTPRGPFGTALPGPVLIDIRVHDFRLH